LASGPGVKTKTRDQTTNTLFGVGELLPPASKNIWGCRLGTSGACPQGYLECGSVPHRGGGSIRVESDGRKGIERYGGRSSGWSRPAPLDRIERYLRKVILSFLKKDVSGDKGRGESWRQ